MSLGTRRLDGQQLEQYWHDVSARHATASENGFELICYAGMPQWFNSFIHRYQIKAFSNIVAGEPFAGARVLDIGTGVGRWARWYASWPNANVTGIDIERERLEKARTLCGDITYREMRADALEFADGSFDVVNCVTVLQHVPHDVKRAAIAEIGRVAAPNARIVLFELTDLGDDAPHVFPWKQEQWESEFAAHGFRPSRRVGTEYIPLLRMFKRLHRTGARESSRAEINALKNGRRTAKDRAALAALRGAVLLSHPIEQAAMALAPARYARITGWLFRKGRA